MEPSLATLDRPADEPSASPVHPEEQPSWTARPVVATLLRIAIFLAPILASVLASFLVARRWPRPEGFVPTLGWLAVLIVVGGIAMITIDRVARRFLPLTALLRMTLIFPDQAPSRFSLAIRSGTTKQLERRLEQVREHGLGETEAEAAETLLHLAAALREHDRFTRGHGERVRAYTALIGEEMGLDPTEISKLQWAGLIHDIGKLAVPEEILNKPGRLTAEEYDLIKTHPAEGMAMMGPLTGWLGEWALAVGEHHERWDGAGYPAGLAGEEISLAGRIVAVADTFDVVTATRSYKPAQSPQWARRELANNAGTQFDPEVVRAFLNVSLGRLRGVMWPLSWIAHIPFLGSTVTAPATGLTAATVAVVGSSITGVGLAADLPPEIDSIRRSPVVAAQADDIDVSPSATTSTIVVDGLPAPTIVVAAELADPPDGATATPIVIVVTTTTAAAAEPELPVIATIPPTTLVVTAPTVPATGTTVPEPTPTTLAVTTSTTSPSVATPTTATATTPTTVAPTTVAPTTTLGAKTCEGARSGVTDLAGADLSGCDLSGLVLTGVDLSGAVLASANLSGIRMSDFTLDDAVLSGANLAGAVLTDGSMLGTNATIVDGQGIRIERVDATGIKLTQATLDDGWFVDVSFASATATGVEFQAAQFVRVTFASAGLRQAVFDEAVFTDVTMQGATLRAATFDEADARATDWTDANLRNSELADANLADGRLDGADILGADLEDTDLRNATGVPVGASAAEYNDTICPDGTVQSSNCWP